MIIHRSENIHRSMAALTSLIRLSSASTIPIAPFFVAVSDVEPFISHMDALVDVLNDSNPEKQHFRALIGLARATFLLYQRDEVSDDFVRDIREQLIKLIRTYRCAIHSPNTGED